MKKWLLLLLAILLALVWKVTDIYINTYQHLNIEQQNAIEKAKKTNDLEKVENIEYYYGKTSYQVVYGNNKENESIIVWVSEDETEDMIVRKATEGWTKEQVMEQVLKERDPMKIIDIRLGAELITNTRTGKEEVRPLWEVTYLDEQQRYTYYYLSFSDGSFLKRYSLKKDRFKGDI